MSEQHIIMICHRSSSTCVIFILVASLLHIAKASWPLGLQNLAIAPPPSNMWPGMRILPAAGLPVAQASMMQPLAVRDLQLAYPLQPLNMGHYSPLEIASEQELLHIQRAQHRRRLNRERERLRLREREQRLRQRELHRPPVFPTIRYDQPNRTNNLFDPSDKGGPMDIPNKIQSERMKASSDDDFVLMHKLNNNNNNNNINNNDNMIRTTIRPFDDDHKVHNDMPPDPPKNPVDIRRKTLSSPNGQVTYITEMLYDVGDSNPNAPLKVTRPPTSPSFIPAPNEGPSFAPTDDPRTAANPFITVVPPPSNGVLSRPPSELPVTEWATILPTPPTAFRANRSPGSPRPTDKNEQTEGSERRESNFFPTERNTASAEVGNNFNGNNNNHPQQQQQNHHHHHSNPHRTLENHQPTNGFRNSYFPKSSLSFNEGGKSLSATPSSPSLTKAKTWKGSGEGLGAAAIAGIVIGSLVSITLLAGTALFVMYKSPFGKRTEVISERHSHIPVQNVSRAYVDSISSRSDSDPKVHRLPPRTRHQHHSQHQLQQHHFHRSPGYPRGSAC